MLQSMGSQRVSRDWATDQRYKIITFPFKHPRLTGVRNEMVAKGRGWWWWCWDSLCAPTLQLLGLSQHPGYSVSPSLLGRTQESFNYTHPPPQKLCSFQGRSEIQEWVLTPGSSPEPKYTIADEAYTSLLPRWTALSAPCTSGSPGRSALHY